MARLLTERELATELSLDIDHIHKAQNERRLDPAQVDPNGAQLYDLDRATEALRPEIRRANGHSHGHLLILSDLAKVLGLRLEAVNAARNSGRLVHVNSNPRGALFDLDAAKHLLAREIACRGGSGDALAEMNEKIFLSGADLATLHQII